MKLSEAIRLGAAMKPQAYGAYLWSQYFPGNASQMYTCAIGAAMDAIGILNTVGSDDKIRDCIPESWSDLLTKLIHAPCPHPGCGMPSSGIVHLNDHHKWTREKIADWVELFDGVPEESSINEQTPAECMDAELVDTIFGS